MGNINLYGIKPDNFKVVKESSNFDLGKAIDNIAKGFTDENVVAMYVKDKIAYQEKNDSLLRKDPSYSVYDDPQFRGLEEYMGNFLHANNKEHASHLLKNFMDGTDKYKTAPSYIVGRILGGLTDPSSLFFFSKAGNFLMQGNRLARAVKSGSLVTGEELIKRRLSSDRPVSDTGIISAAGFILPAIFPAIPSKSVQGFDEVSKFYDDLDSYYKMGGSVGAMANLNIRKELDQKAKELNKIYPTGLGIFGENSRTTPVFRTLQEKITAAQEFIEKTLEIPLLQKKNFLDGITETSIERNVRSRYYEVIQSNEEMMSVYDKYLHYKGKSGRNIVEKLVDRKFTFEKEIMGPLKFREYVFEKMLMGKNYKIGALDDITNDFIKEAAETQRKFYDKLVDEYDSNKIVQSYLETNIERLNFFIDKAKTKLADRPKMAAATRELLENRIVRLQVQVNKLQNRLDTVNKNGIRRRDYVNIVFKRDALDNRFSDFERIMKSILVKSNPKFANFTDEEINAIIQGYKNYQPVIQFENVFDIVGRQIPKVETVDRISARFYGRHIDLGKDGYKKLMDAGFIEKDLTYLNRLYFNQVVPDIEVTKVFGDPLGLGSRAMRDPESNFEEGLLRIDLDYGRMIRVAKEQGDNKKVISLSKEREEALEDAYAAIQLVQGTRGLSDDPNKLSSRLIRMTKLYNA